MKKCLLLALALGMIGCGASEEPTTKEEKKRSSRPVPMAKLKPNRPKEEKTTKPGEPEAPKPYTYGDLVFALQEDAKAKQQAGRIDGTDPRIFKPDIRHERIRVVLAENYQSQITLPSVLKLRDELCKANNFTPAQVDAIPLDEVAEAFEKGQ